MSNERPVEIQLHQQSRTLELTYEDGQTYCLTCEYLRVYSPSAEVRGHGPGQEVLQTGKEEVAIVAIEPVGHYAVKLVFSDGHDSGIYDWRYLRQLCDHQAANWQSYLEQLLQHGYDRKVKAEKAP